MNVSVVKRCGVLNSDKNLLSLCLNNFCIEIILTYNFDS